MRADAPDPYGYLGRFQPPRCCCLSRACFSGRIGAYPHAILGAFVPLITAVGMAFNRHGPEYDESLEVTRSTPVSPRLILLSRVALAFVFDFHARPDDDARS